MRSLIKNLKPDKVLKHYMTPSVFQEFSLLSDKFETINLGQGFPNWPITNFLENALNTVIDQDIHSDTHLYGCNNLLKELAIEYSPVFNRELNSAENFIVSNGGQTLLSSICSNLLPGEEVIIVEPYFSFYEPMLKFFRASLKFVKLKQSGPGRFVLDMEELERVLTPQTKWIWFNSPHNPTGKVFTASEYEQLATLLENFPKVRLMSDEVYEKICFGELPMTHMANIANLWDRTVSVYSGGKTFSCTGWRVGWAVGPKKLIRELKATQIATNEPASSVLQESLAIGIQEARKPYNGFESYYESLQNDFRENVNILVRALEDSPFDFKIIEPEGGYFMAVDITQAIKKMPAYYLFSPNKRDDHYSLKDVYLDCIEDYENFPGNTIL